MNWLPVTPVQVDRSVKRQVELVFGCRGPDDVLHDRQLLAALRQVEGIGRRTRVVNHGRLEDKYKIIFF